MPGFHLICLKELQGNGKEEQGDNWILKEESSNDSDLAHGAQSPTG